MRKRATNESTPRTNERFSNAEMSVLGRPNTNTPALCAQSDDKIYEMQTTYSVRQEFCVIKRATLREISIWH